MTDSVGYYRCHSAGSAPPINQAWAGAARMPEPRCGSIGSGKLCWYSPHTLQRLIKDVEDGVADFQATFVCGVSRWGRFQDAEESAYYE